MDKERPKVLAVNTYVWVIYSGYLKSFPFVPAVDWIVDPTAETQCVV